MPNIPSAAKRVRSDAKRRAENQTVQSELKTISKKLYSLASSQNLQKASEYARLVISKYDTAASNGKIPRQRADRKKARVASLLAKLTAKSKK